MDQSSVESGVEEDALDPDAIAMAIISNSLGESMIKNVGGLSCLDTRATCVTQILRFSLHEFMPRYNHV